MHIEGVPGARGRQHGYLLAREIAESIRLIRGMWEHGSGLDWAWVVDKAWPMLRPNLDPESLAELEGIVEGMQAAGVRSSVAEIVTYNAWFELGLLSRIYG